MRNFAICALAGSVQAVNLASQAATEAQTLTEMLVGNCQTFTFEMDFHEVIDNMNACFEEHLLNLRDTFPADYDWANNMDALVEAIKGFDPAKDDPEDPVEDPVDPVIPDPVVDPVDPVDPDPLPYPNLTPEARQIMEEISAYVGVDMSEAYPVDYDWAANAHTLTYLVSLPLMGPVAEALTWAGFQELMDIVPSMWASERHAQQIYARYASEPYTGLTFDEQTYLWADLMGDQFMKLTDDDGYLPGAWRLDFTDTMEDFRKEYMQHFDEVPDAVMSDDEWVDPNFLWYNVSQQFSHLTDGNVNINLEEFTAMCFTFGMYDMDAIPKMHHHYWKGPNEDMGHWQNWNMWNDMIKHESMFGFNGSVWANLGEPKTVQTPLADGGFDTSTEIWNLDFTISMREF